MPVPYLGRQKSPTKMEKVRKFQVLKGWMFSFEAEASPVALAYFIKA
jgi:hypothetical protein